MTFLSSIAGAWHAHSRSCPGAILALLATSAVVACSSASGSGGDAEESALTGDSGDDDEGTLISLGGPSHQDSDSGILAGEESASHGGAGGAAGDLCLSFMSWGSVAQRGAVPGAYGQDAIVAWLNETSTASGEHFEEKPEITPEFLGAFDVILLQDLSQWEFSDEEVNTFKEWVLTGGGVMALSGYSSDPMQVTTTNRLLSFSGLNYASENEAPDTSTNIGECGYCLGVTHRQGGWNPDHPIAAGITAVGAYQGRAIHGDGDIVAQEDGNILAMAKSIEEGRVFLFHDEWVSFNTQWSALAPAECSENPQCADASPATTYQIPQFWFNSFRWLSHGSDCFSIDDSGILR